MVKDEQELRPTSRDTYTHFPDLLLRNDQSITNSRCSGSCTAALAKPACGVSWLPRRLSGMSVKVLVMSNETMSSRSIVTFPSNGEAIYEKDRDPWLWFVGLPQTCLFNYNGFKKTLAAQLPTDRTM